MEIIIIMMVGVYLLVALCVGVLMLKRKSNGHRRVRKHSLSPLKISLFILIGLTAAGMIFMSVVGVMIVDWPEGEPSLIVIEIPGPEGEPSSRVDDIPEQTVRDLLDENGYIVNPNQRTARIAEEHRGGYGGYYFDETDRAVAYVYMLDPSEIASAREVFRAIYHGDRRITRIVPVQGNYAYSDLVRWSHALDRALVREGIHTTYGSLLGLSNRVGFGLADMEQELNARRLMQELEIPDGAVVFKEGDNQLLSSRTTLKDALEPIEGDAEVVATVQVKAVTRGDIRRDVEFGW